MPKNRGGVDKNQPDKRVYFGSNSQGYICCSQECETRQPTSELPEFLGKVRCLIKKEGGETIYFHPFFLIKQTFLWKTLDSWQLLQNSVFNFQYRH